ncbi:hypothetical protein [Chitinilyticum litopenaei]|uniref:hypothetical protein n=1 Tax=Chitinilyticum litopenaei TaxID=1121276 RepID=UPI000426D474|nr:hypothetical protein [Chitinilyticum litopenaei]
MAPSLALAANLPQQARPNPALRASGLHLVELLNDNDIQALDAQFDWPALTERMIRGLVIDSRRREALQKLLATMRPDTQRVFGELQGRLEAQTAVARLVKSRPLPTGSLQIVRIDYFAQAEAPQEETMFSYFSFMLDKHGRVRDWVDHDQGGLASDQLGELFQSLLNKRHWKTILLGRPVMDEQALRAQQSFSAAVAKSDWRRAYGALQELPAEYRATLGWAVQRARYASRLDDATFRSALAQLGRQHGSSHDGRLWLYHHYSFQKDYPRMLAVVEAFERHVVVDAVTSYLKCMVHLQSGELGPARTACEKSIVLEPDSQYGWDGLFALESQRRDAAAVLALLARYEQQFAMRITPDDLQGDPANAWLLATPEFKRWAATRSKAR